MQEWWILCGRLDKLQLPVQVRVERVLPQVRGGILQETVGGPL
jgi:hypothetical protein